jgi:hypothetical protein
MVEILVCNPLPLVLARSWYKKEVMVEVATRPVRGGGGGGGEVADMGRW